MGFEAYDKTEEKYQADVLRLCKIAVDISHGNYSVFLTSMAKAWLQASPSEKRILKPAWEAIVTKYSLEAEAEAEQAQLEAEGIEAARAEYEEREEELAQDPEEGMT